ncbi:hypothetical protein EDB81DRAFT_894356 [Dactylonectria macrodidyma]|uniref:Uncharacterized protein n=1 Tax=Dactylonectria macrodidyma TaxID=307937 RepID=A0A9P9D2E5_9HYPO|nr:hypothetical protein EDB81DRAFT_894356 [Dactylonectria macrodidyma]
MAEPDILALRHIKAIKRCVSQWHRDGNAIESPHELYQSQVAALQEKARIENASNHDSNTRTDNILEIGAQLGDLQQQHATTIANDDTVYRQSLDVHVMQRS